MRFSGSAGLSAILFIARGLLGLCLSAAVHAQPAPGALASAILAEDAEAVRAALDAGESPNAPDAQLRRSPLHVAVSPGSPRQAAIVELLVSRGADVNAEDAASGLTPLMAASVVAETGGPFAVLEFQKSKLLAERLIALGADPGRLTRTGETPLLVAVGAGNLEVLRLLIARGAKPDQAGARGETPLARATRLKRDEMVRELIAAGATPRVAARGGVSAAEPVDPDAPAPSEAPAAASSGIGGWVIGGLAIAAGVVAAAVAANNAKKRQAAAQTAAATAPTPAPAPAPIVVPQPLPPPVPQPIAPQPVPQPQPQPNPTPIVVPQPVPVPVPQPVPVPVPQPVPPTVPSPSAPAILDTSPPTLGMLIRGAYNGAPGSVTVNFTRPAGVTVTRVSVLYTWFCAGAQRGVNVHATPAPGANSVLVPSFFTGNLNVATVATPYPGVNAGCPEWPSLGIGRVPVAASIDLGYRIAGTGPELSVSRPFGRIEACPAGQVMKDGACTTPPPVQVFDGEYNSARNLPDGFLHIERIIVAGEKVTALHSFANGTQSFTPGTQLGTFAWTGTITQTGPEQGTISGNGTITINSAGGPREDRPFTLLPGSVVYRNANGVMTIRWSATDPKSGPIGWTSERVPFSSLPPVTIPGQRPVAPPPVAPPPTPAPPPVSPPVSGAVAMWICSVGRSGIPAGYYVQEIATNMGYPCAYPQQNMLIRRIADANFWMCSVDNTGAPAGYVVTEISAVQRCGCAAPVRDATGNVVCRDNGWPLIAVRSVSGTGTVAPPPSPPVTVSGPASMWICASSRSSVPAGYYVQEISTVFGATCAFPQQNMLIRKIADPTFWMCNFDNIGTPAGYALISTSSVQRCGCVAPVRDASGSIVCRDTGWPLQSVRSLSAP